MTSPSGGYLARPTPSGLADVIEIILDKGLVIDAYVRVSVVGIELLTVDARIVIASADTYLRFAEATNRLDLTERQHSVPDLLVSSMGSAMESATEKVVESKVGDMVETASQVVGRLRPTRR